MSTLQLKPALIVIDPRDKTYSRYVGRTCTHYFEIEGDVDLERLRWNPETFTDVEPEAA